MIVQFQPSFRPALPEGFGAKDYRQFRDTLIEMDHILAVTGLEDRLINERVSKLGHEKSSAKRQQFLWRSTRLALRYSILRALTQETFRVLSRQVADSLIFQWFTYTSFVDGVRPVSKSSAERFEKYFTPEQIGELVHLLNKAVFRQLKAQVRVIERHGQRYLVTARSAQGGNRMDRTGEECCGGADAQCTRTVAAGCTSGPRANYRRSAIASTLPSRMMDLSSTGN